MNLIFNVRFSINLWVAEMSSDINLTSLLIGWILGVAGPLIIYEIKKRFNRKDLLNGINSEFKELQFKYIHLAYQLGLHSANFDRDFLKWCLTILRKFDETDKPKALSDRIKQLLSPYGKTLNYYLNREREKSIKLSLSLKKYRLAFLDSKVNEISMLNTDFQRVILDIKAWLDLINDEIENTRKYHYMTFDSSISYESHEIVKEQIYNNFENIQEMIISIVNKIENYLERQITLNKESTLTPTLFQ